MLDLDKIQDRWDALLTPTQIEFVDAMVVTQKLAPAAKMVGIAYGTATKYLKSPKIQAAIQLRKRSLREDLCIDPAEVITDMRILRDMSMGRIPVPETKWVDGVPVTHYVTQFNPQAAHKAVENLGRIAGMYVERREITIPATDTQLTRRLEELLGVSLDGEFEEVATEPLVESDGVSIPEISSAAVNAVFDEIADMHLNDVLSAACDEELGPDGE